MTCVRIGCAMVLAFGVVSQAAAQEPARPLASNVRRVTIEEAVRSALENNLGVQVARIDPQVQDLSVALARTAWSPTVTSTFQGASTDTPSNSFLSGAQGPKTSDDRLNTTVGVGQALPWGGSYTVGWDSVRSTTTNIRSEERRVGKECRL